jgi:hypothetical protein
VLNWRAIGQLFPPAGGAYAALPFAVPTGESDARVYFSGRDEQNRAHISACTLDLDRLTIDPATIPAQPLLGPGALGAFDESGCSMSCIVRQGSRWLLYYTGWMLGRTVPFYLAIGLAVSDDDGRTFRKHSLAPILDRNDVDPFLTASPSVLLDGDTWRMWYVSATHWEPRPEGPRHHYLIKYAESRDGIHWERGGRVAIPFAGDEYAMGRPHVFRDGDVYRMAFCVRGDHYRLAWAESADGLTWTRNEHTPPPASAWDAEMQAYPMILRHRERWLMLYNGNGYGATGFGCAVAESAA